MERKRELTVKDNGIGIPKDMDLSEVKTLGMISNYLSSFDSPDDYVI